MDPITGFCVTHAGLESGWPPPGNLVRKHQQTHKLFVSSLLHSVFLAKKSLISSLRDGQRQERPDRRGRREVILKVKHLLSDA